MSPPQRTGASYTTRKLKHWMYHVPETCTVHRRATIFHTQDMFHTCTQAPTPSLHRQPHATHTHTRTHCIAHSAHNTPVKFNSHSQNCPTLPPPLIYSLPLQGDGHLMWWVVEVGQLSPCITPHPPGAPESSQVYIESKGEKMELKWIKQVLELLWANKGSWSC